MITIGKRSSVQSCSAMSLPEESPSFQGKIIDLPFLFTPATHMKHERLLTIVLIVSKILMQILLQGDKDFIDALNIDILLLTLCFYP